eukprot:14992-Heterococcus_DN1.PRE.4
MSMTASLLVLAMSGYTVLASAGLGSDASWASTSVHSARCTSPLVAFASLLYSVHAASTMQQLR